jgi:hypothetical protein
LKAILKNTVIPRIERSDFCSFQGRLQQLVGISRVLKEVGISKVENLL